MDKREEACGRAAEEGGASEISKSAVQCRSWLSSPFHCFRPTLYVSYAKISCSHVFILYMY